MNHAPSKPPKNYSDAQLAELVRKRLHQSAEHGLEAVQVSCRHGVIRLAGHVATEALRQLAVGVADGELELETIDDIRVAPFARRARASDRGGDVAVDPAPPGGEPRKIIFDEDAGYDFQI